MGTARLNVPTDGRFDTNNTHSFASYAMQKDLGFNPGVYGAGLSI
jgi:hypothetical protein